MFSPYLYSSADFQLSVSTSLCLGWFPSLSLSLFLSLSLLRRLFCLLAEQDWNIKKSIHTLEKAMAPHSSTLAWKIPRTEEPGGLQSMGSLRVEHDWVTSLSLFTFIHWRRKWQPTLVFLPGESQGWGILVGCRLRGRTELDTTEAT